MKGITGDNVQGLVSKGCEETSLIVAHGLRHLTSAKLQGPGSLSLAGKHKLENLPIVQEARIAKEEAHAKYKDAVSSGNQDAALVERLWQGYLSAHSRLSHVRANLRRKELNELALQAEEQNNISALLGKGPAAAAQALVRHLQPESRANQSASTTAHQEPGRINDATVGDLPVALSNNGHDGCDGCDGRDTNDANAGQTGGEPPLFLGGYDGSNDDGKSEDNDTPEEQSWMQEFVNTKVSQRCSTLLEEMVESLQEHSNDTDADASWLPPPQPLEVTTSLPPEGPLPSSTSSSPLHTSGPLPPAGPSTSSQQHSPGRPFPSPPDLRQHLYALHMQFAALIPLPVPDYVVLKRPSRYEDISTLYEALSSSNVGTRNGAAELLHTKKCVRRPAIEMYEQACIEVASGKACPYSRCVSKGTEFPAKAAAIHEHLYNHRKSTMATLTCTEERKVKTFECPLVSADANASPCRWTLQASEGVIDAQTVS
ncbi:uncharacterized protein UTRI_01365 [Ustilago trichophora]|uniref:Uncharacterized protein n=1 Tax=Ustilago trichophora TaxID=86804 RepID=A0A5C3DZF2_9BASI|nr:uncharacterized protein UTRI_01365 [Ustilago trichophora]